MTYDIRDIQLADRGQHRIAWAARNMPVLRQITDEFAATRPFAGRRIAAALHITPETAVLMRALQAGGAEIALCASKRSQAVPDIPTMEEAGFPGFDISQWFAVTVPRGTPDEVVHKLYTEFSEALKVPDIRKRQIEQGYEPIGSTPEVFAQYLKDEIAKYGKLIKDTGIVLN